MSEKVLVIDDYLPAAEILKWAMEAMGHEVRIALNGKSALAEVRTFTPDIVLCDIKLPDMTGYELCRILKDDPNLHDALLLAQTGYDGHDRKQQSYEAGFHYHLVKPVDINKLLEIVYLDRAGKQRQKRAHSQEYSDG